MRLLAIDPGTTQSGWVVYEDGAVLDSGISPNGDVLDMLDRGIEVAEMCATEMVASYGMAVGAEVFRTVWWTGRFAEAWKRSTGRIPMEIFRKHVALHVCNSPRASDSNLRVALIDLIGPKGTKADPGPTYGMNSHTWAALGVAVTADHQLRNPCA